MSDEARRAFVLMLHAKRLALGLRQADVGAAVGVHGNTIGYWEMGSRRPTAANAEKWAAAVGVRVVGGSLDELFWAPPRCETPAAYKRHLKLGERCPPCWAAWSRHVGALKKKAA